jgi:ribonucleoside-diphosphate reductase alpha chain
MGFTSVRKRDGEVVAFDSNRIKEAILKAFQVTQEGSDKDAEKITEKVIKELGKRYEADQVFGIEAIQDVIEEQLIALEFGKTAKSYILYREERSKVREIIKKIPENVQKLATDSKNYFRNPLGEFVYYRSYSRWIEDEGRRETWIETVDRYLNFMRENIGNKLTDAEYAELREGILKQESMPSMRLLQFSGAAARRTNVCAYNCSFISPTKSQDFAEILYISMCGTGVGFSVESQNVQQLPQINRQAGKRRETFVVEDSKEGWADAMAYGMETWFAGEDLDFDYSKLRPAGARLKVMGGKSSGPDPLKFLLAFTREKILRKQGRRLSNLDVHDIVCKIGECVVAGGVRRSALISLSDLDDPEMRDAKKGQFYFTEPQRSIANNSAVYINKPSNTEFLDEWMALMKSGSGERGIFNRGSLTKTLPERRLKLLKDYIHDGKMTGFIGTNPCGEIILRSKQFCNLSEVVARAEDTEETLLQKVRRATILGTYQSTLTNFGYLSKDWRNNCEEERLLGVSITGQWDSPAVRNPETLAKMREEAIRVNQEYAKKLGVNPSSCITCVKPSGTVSQTVDCSSGMHPRHAPYYIRRVRIASSDALFKMLRDQKVPHYPEVGQAWDSASTFVFEFPVKAPSGSVFRDDLTALQQLEYWKMIKLNYTEHNPSVTISVGDNEWLAVANWVYENWDIIGGLSFLPRDNHVYPLAPYEAITEEKYKEMVENFPRVDFSHILVYEQEDETNVAKELACAGGTCEII